VTEGHHEKPAKRQIPKRLMETTTLEGKQEIYKAKKCAT
jgi:hypothetical protein